MEIVRLGDGEKKRIDALVNEFAQELVLSESISKRGSIGIYGIPDFEVLDYFQSKMGEHLFGLGLGHIKVTQNTRGDYPIDLGSYLDYIFENKGAIQG